MGQGVLDTYFSFENLEFKTKKGKIIIEYVDILKKKEFPLK